MYSSFFLSSAIAEAWLGEDDRWNACEAERSGSCGREVSGRRWEQQADGAMEAEEVARTVERRLEDFLCLRLMRKEAKENGSAGCNGVSATFLPNPTCLILHLRRYRTIRGTLPSPALVSPRRQQPCRLALSFAPSGHYTAKHPSEPTQGRHPFRTLRVTRPPAADHLGTRTSTICVTCIV